MLACKDVLKQKRRMLLQEVTRHCSQKAVSISIYLLNQN